jgi:hypothetical protein
MVARCWLPYTNDRLKKRSPVSPSAVNHCIGCPSYWGSVKPPCRCGVIGDGPIVAPGMVRSTGRNCPPGSSFAHSIVTGRSLRTSKVGPR